MAIKFPFQRHALIWYFILAFLIAWGGSFAAVGSKFIRGEALELSDALLVFLVMLIGPSLTGILMTGIVDGKSGLRDLFARMLLWRVGARWYSPILIFPALVLAVQLGLTALISRDFAPYFFPVGLALGLLAQLMHASSTGFLAILVPLSLSPRNSTIFYGVYALALWAVVVVVALFKNPGFSKKPGF